MLMFRATNAMSYDTRSARYDTRWRWSFSSCCNCCCFLFIIIGRGREQHYAGFYILYHGHHPDVCANTFLILPPKLSCPPRKTKNTTLPEKINTARLLNAVNSVLLWGKCIKFIGFFPYIQLLFHTVKDAMSNFFMFLILFLVLHFAFVVSFVTAFGDVIGPLTTVQSAWIFTLRAIAADIDIIPIYNYDKTVGTILILLFLIGVLLVGINVFFAIMAATLMENRYLKKREADDKEEAIVVMITVAREVLAAWFLAGVINTAISRSIRCGAYSYIEVVSDVVQRSMFCTYPYYID